jgi:Virulence protein
MLFDTTRENIVQHIRNIYQEAELQEDRTCKSFLQVQTEGNRSVKRNIPNYNLDLIIAIGYRVKSQVATRFRQWATQRLHEYIQKGFAMKELQVLNLLVSQYLDFAELQAIEQHSMTMQQWIEKLDSILSVGNRPLLNNAGTISHQQAVKKATQEFEDYRQKEMLQYESDFDRVVKELKSQADDKSNNTPD